MVRIKGVRSNPLSAQTGSSAANLSPPRGQRRHRGDATSPVTAGSSQQISPRSPLGSTPHSLSPESKSPGRAPEERSPRSKRRLKAGMGALREIRKLQNSTDLLLRKAPFRRLVRQLAESANHKTTPGTFRFQSSALDCLQEGCEAYLIHLMEDANLCSLHGKRITVQPKDLHLSKRIRNEHF